MNPLSNLKVDAWYTILLVLSACVLIVSLTVELKVRDPAVVQLAAFGGVLLGLGEFINHPKKEGFIPPTFLQGGIKITSHARDACFFGVLLDIVACMLWGLALWRSLK